MWHFQGILQGLKFPQANSLNASQICDYRVWKKSLAFSSQLPRTCILCKKINFKIAKCLNLISVGKWACKKAANCSKE